MEGEEFEDCFVVCRVKMITIKGFATVSFPDSKFSASNFEKLGNDEVSLVVS